MKRIITAAALVLMLSVQAFALSDAEYKNLKKSSADFARADRRLSQVWKKLSDNMPGRSFRRLQQEQREWVAEGRDYDADSYMEMGYSRAEAYTMATNDRADYLPKRAREIMNGD